MAIIHHQFKSIHPFYYGNGRTGRIINLLYLVSKELLDLPILYLSRYIIQHKAKYYQTIQTVRDNGNRKDWLLYILTEAKLLTKLKVGTKNYYLNTESMNLLKNNTNKIKEA